MRVIFMLGKSVFLCSWGDVPQLHEQLLHAGVMLFKFPAGEREEIVAREKCLGAFREILHGVGHGISSFAGVGTSIPEPTLHLLISAAGLCPLVGSFDLRITKAAREHPVVVGMR